MKFNLRYLMPSLLLFAAVAGAPSVAIAQSEQQTLVNAAEKSFQDFWRDPEMTWLQKNIGRARGVLIAPQIAKAGFVFGGSGGRAVFVALDPQTGKWAGPAFYTLATVSVGFQAGVSVSEVVTLVMTEKAVNSLLSSSFKMGADASIAAGPIGGGAGSAPVADLITFSRAKGVYGGVNLDGTVVKMAEDWNAAYYGKPALPPDILVRQSVKNPDASRLLATLGATTAAK